MIKRVLLINPPWYRLFGSGVTLKIPLGLCYISAVLNKNGFEAWVYDAEFYLKGTLTLSISGMTENIDDYLKVLEDLNHPLWGEIEEKIKKFKPDVVGISVKTPSFKSGLNIARICKRLNQSIKVVMGGPHVSCLPRETVASRYVDFAVISEGEYTFLELLRLLNTGQEVKDCKGIAYKDNNGNVFINPRRELIQNLDELPDPDREHLLDGEKYPKDSYGEIFTGRGCPYDCIFCASKCIWGRTVRNRTPERVVDEIEFIHKQYGTGYFYIEDDTFMLNKGVMNGICDLLMKRKLPIRWECETRVNLLTEGLLKKIKEAGCVMINIGVESGNDETLSKIKKGITVKQIEEAFKIIHKVKMPVSAFIMVGFPWETENDMVHTVDFTQRLRPDRLILSVVTPYPNTEIFEICNEGYNLHLGESFQWEEFFHQSNRLVLPEMTREGFYNLVKALEKRAKSYTIKMRMKSLDFWKTRIVMYLKRPKKILDDILSLKK